MKEVGVKYLNPEGA